MLERENARALASHPRQAPNRQWTTMVESLCRYGSRGEVAACVVIKKSSRPMPSSRHVGHRWGAVRGRIMSRFRQEAGAVGTTRPAPRFRALLSNGEKTWTLRIRMRTHVERNTGASERGRAIRERAKRR